MDLGLVCMFSGDMHKQIRYRTTTVKVCAALSDSDRVAKVDDIVLHNVTNLLNSVQFCADNGINCFRISSDLFPLATHADLGYHIASLPSADAIYRTLSDTKQLAQSSGVRLLFHPDQFCVLSSPKPEVVSSTVKELDFHAQIAVLVGADALIVHGGGVYGDKDSALQRFADNFRLLSDDAQRMLVVENDDRSYTVEDLLPLCQTIDIPLVYDVHHHRCNQDSLSVEDATTRALSTWTDGRTPLFHISSPRDGWDAKNPRPHHDFIDINDFPLFWLDLDVHVEVEAKSKQEAVLNLTDQLTLERT